MRKPAATPTRDHVKLSVPLPISDHAKLCWVAATRRCDRSQVAAEILRRGLKLIAMKDTSGSDEPEGSSAG
jgi:hypothetical protein